MSHLAEAADVLPGGIMGRILRIDLTAETIAVETLSPAMARMWLGGTGLGAKLLYDEVPAGVEWDDPENRLIIAAGPLAGTKVHGAGTYSAVTKGPMTNLLGATQANGFFGAYLKQNGYDAIILQGRASRWLYLFIGPEGVLELRSADHLLGKDTWETEGALLEELGYKFRMLSVHSIGQAGEHLVRFAAIAGDQGHVAAHNGVGAVMGSKRLKCIAVARGKQQVPVAHPERLTEYADALFEHAYEFRDRWLARGGTAVGLSDQHTIGSLPVRNYTTNIFPEHEAMNGLTFRENFDGKHTPCWACRMNHLHTGCMTEGRKKGYVGEEPEYEGFAAFGPQVGITDQSAAFWLSNLADRYAVDLNEAGWLLGWVLECVDKGILDKQRDLDGLDLKWDDEDTLAELLRKIALREGCGDWLAEGVMRAAQHIGRGAEELAVFTKKGASPRGHDHRGRWTEMLDTCVSNTSTIEATAGADPVDHLPIEAVKNRFDPLDVSRFVGQINGRRQFDDSLGVCRFDSQDLMLELHTFNAVTGLDYSPLDALRKGRQMVHLMRAFNVRHGLTADLEEPSSRYASNPTDGAAADSHPEQAWPIMKRNYYRTMGWDESSGLPLASTLRELDLEELIPDFTPVGTRAH
jgi:aldehyde:ferredoxin oxidoreductase